MTGLQYGQLVKETQDYLLAHYAGNEQACFWIRYMRLPRLIAWAKRLGWEGK